MIDKIEIIILKNLEEHSYLIDYKEKTCTYNTTTRSVSEEDLNELMNQMVLLNKEYGETSAIDAEEFTIKINNELISHGKGYYPQEYLSIKYILGNINAR